MLRLMGFLVLVLAGAGGILFLDYNRTVQAAGAGEATAPSFRSYIEAVPARLVSLSGSSQASSTTKPLADLMPRPPEGWTARPVQDTDIASFLPKSRGKGDPASIDLVKAAGSSRAAKGTDVAILAFEKGERRVVFQVTRHPDRIFASLEAIERRFDLQMQAAEVRGRPFITARGLDVTEEFLGDGMRVRYFTASVGAQIQIRVLASKRLKDAELLAFFETLNVQALNAAVIDRQPGLGEVPVMVLASALGEADLAAYEADRAARADAAVRRARDLRAAAEAERALAAEGAGVAPDTGSSPAAVSTCKKDAGGIKRCSVSPQG